MIDREGGCCALVVLALIEPMCNHNNMWAQLNDVFFSVPSYLNLVRLLALSVTLHDWLGIKIVMRYFSKGPMYAYYVGLHTAF